MDLKQKMRTGHVRRWHIVAVSREQTIADHMHRVGILTEEILTILGLFSWDSSITLNAMRWAFIHDRHEVLLGDIPTPGKARIGDAIIERAAEHADREYAELSDCGMHDALFIHVVKMADLIEAMNYMGMFGCGLHAREVWRKIYDEAQDMVLHVTSNWAVTNGRSREDLTNLQGRLRNMVDSVKEGAQWT